MPASNLILIAEENPVDDDELIEKVKKAFFEVSVRFRGPGTPESIALVESRLCGLMSVKWEGEHSPITTMAVSLNALGKVTLHLSRQFVQEKSITTLAFGLCHEAFHLMRSHLHEPEHARRDEHMTMAKEVIINDRICRLYRKDIPTEPDGFSPINPAEMFKKYVSVTGDKKTSYDDFVRNEYICAEYLRKQKQIEEQGQKGGKATGKGPSSKIGVECDHGHAGEDPGSSADGVDQEAAEKIMRDIIADVVREAINGSAVARKAIQNAVKDMPDSDIWGDFPLGQIIGESMVKRAAPQWLRWTQQAIGSRLVQGSTPRYDRKIGWFAACPITPSGRETEKLIHIYLDLSGSMYAISEKIAALVGGIDNVEVKWFTFDVDVYPHTPGDTLQGGGGTSFSCIMDNEQQEDEPPDAIVVVTDGDAGKIFPENPQEWIWIVTHGGMTKNIDDDMTIIMVDEDFDGATSE